MNRIAVMRKKHNLSQKELGSIIGVAQNTICNWEKGNREPDYKSLKKMAFYFNCSTDYLLGRTEFGQTSVFDEQIDSSLDWANSSLTSDKKEKPTPVSGDGLDPELVDLIKRIPADRMPEVERYLRFQAAQEEKP